MVSRDLSLQDVIITGVKIAKLNNSQLLKKKLFLLHISFFMFANLLIENLNFGMKDDFTR